MTRGARRLICVAASFLLVSVATRIGLALYSAENFAVQEWGRFMSVGFMFDLAVLPFFLLPWTLYDAIMPAFPEHHALSKWESRWASVWVSLYLTCFVVIAVSEFVFWAEFGSRFDFIAVDYLVYTHEVIGNIRESYPVTTWLALIFGGSAAVTWFGFSRAADGPRSTRTVRWVRVAATACAILLSVVVVDQKMAKTQSDAYVQQLSGNGIYAFAHAFQHNQLDYDKYYPVLEAEKLNARIRALTQQSNSKFIRDTGIERKVTARTATKNVNVVLVSIESLSAEYLGIFGNTLGLTPELDKLAEQGLLFTNLYATGTRTVRGLEALSVGTPPTPGQSIVRRPKNDNLENLGGELKKHGWAPYWIYGGYGFFDNMNAYFKGNGYAIADRSDMEAEGLPTHAENIWGIADEDLYSLAMAKLDKQYAQNHRFFAHIMITSNHRPYTFPENRIDLPQKHREGAVKYTDWAIGDFIRRAAKKPWFNKTLFIFIADHTAKASGRTDMPPSRYHIPMIWYAPGLVEPGVMGRLMSQMDTGPTLLGWLGLSHTSGFFGYDIFNLEAGRERAFISTYQKLGYLKDGRLVVLDVNQPPVVLNGLTVTPGVTARPGDDGLVEEAIAWYQSASLYFRLGLLKDSADNGVP